MAKPLLLPDFSDVSQTYLEQAARPALLSREEEIILARKIRRGDNRARARMIESNLRLVVVIAKEYAECGLSMADLIQEGNIGLMTAAKRFMPNRGAKFSTYAGWWIRQAIRKALCNSGRCVRLPTHIIAKAFKINKARRTLEESLRREPLSSDIASAMGWPVDKVERVVNASRFPLSLDAPAEAMDGEDSSLLDAFEDEDAVRPDDASDTALQFQQVHELLGYLDERSAAIIIMRFGLNGSNPMTLERVGAALGITRERVRQLQADSLRMMRMWLQLRDGPFVAYLPRPYRMNTHRLRAKLHAGVRKTVMRKMAAQSN